MSNIKKWVVIFIMGLTCQLLWADNIKYVDGIVAVVDNDVITSQELNDAMVELKSQIPPDSTIDNNSITQRALLELVNQSLLTQAAKRSGITVTDADIDDAIHALAQSKKMTVDESYKNASKAGVSKTFLRQNVANSLFASKLEQSEVMSRGQVTDAEIDDAITRAKAAGRELPPPLTSHTYHVQHILLKDDNEPNRLLINQIAQQARAGADFSQLARQYSQDNSAAQGGDLGWISEGQTVPVFENAVKQLQPGQVSLPVRSQFGWHIIKLVEVKSNNDPEQQQRNGMRAVLAQEKKEAVIDNLLKELHQQAYIQVR